MASSSRSHVYVSSRVAVPYKPETVRMFFDWDNNTFHFGNNQLDTTRMSILDIELACKDLLSKIPLIQTKKLNEFHLCITAASNQTLNKPDNKARRESDYCTKTFYYTTIPKAANQLAEVIKLYRRMNE